MTRITDYTALAIATAADVLPIVDVTDTTMSAAGTTKNITVAALLGAPVLQPTGDTTGTDDGGFLGDALSADGIAFLGPGTFYWDTPGLVGTRQVIAGCGPSTIIWPGSGWSGSYMAALASPASTYEATIRDILFYCGNANGSGVLSGPGGVQLDNTGYANTPGGGIDNPVDPLHTLDNIWVVNAGGDGFHLDNHVRELRCTRCKAYRCAGYGFYLGDAGGAGSGCTDSHFTDCTSGFSGNHGFYILNSNNMLTACKAFTAGFNFFTGATGTTECGFELSGSQCLVNTLTGCSAQQASLHGFDLQSCSNISVTGCQADSNGAGTSGSNGAGININTATYCTITGNTGKQVLTPGAQVYGIQHEAGESTGTWIGMNSVQGTSDTFGYVAGSGYYLVDGPTTTDFSNVNEFRVGMPELYPATIQALSSSSAITLSNHFGTYPVSLTGSVTGITLTAGPKGGQQIAIVNTSASDTVTFAASGTSGVAGGTSVVIQPLQALSLTWDANTSLWYPLA